MPGSNEGFDAGAVRSAGPQVQDGNVVLATNERSQLMAQYEHVPCHVVDARYLGDYKVWLEFNDGRKGVVDLADELYGDEFESLRDRDRFAAFVLDYGLATIAWENGVDFAPDYLYERLNAVH
jgi:Protein of unknown function (DUF2442)